MKVISTIVVGKVCDRNGVSCFLNYPVYLRDTRSLCFFVNNVRNLVKRLATFDVGNSKSFKSFKSFKSILALSKKVKGSNRVIASVRVVRVYKDLWVWGLRPTILGEGSFSFWGSGYLTRSNSKYINDLVVQVRVQDLDSVLELGLVRLRERKATNVTNVTNVTNGFYDSKRSNAPNAKFSNVANDTNFFKGSKLSNRAALNNLQIPAFRLRLRGLNLLRLRCGDIEAHPGPVTVPAQEKQDQKATLQLVTQNVRGLGDSKKVRHLINNCYKLSKKASNSIYFFQETFVSKLSLVNYLWRGEHHLTPGTGNSQGCLTLVTSPYKILRTIELGSRGHILVLTENDINKAELIVANVYAPNNNDEEKIAFFSDVLDELADLEATYHCNQLFLAGDLNLVFSDSEVLNRARLASEQRVADRVKSHFDRLHWVDCWSISNEKYFTWSSNRNATQAFSTLDRIMMKGDKYALIDKKADWALSLSDHAAVLAKFQIKNVNKRSVLISRLDPRLLDDHEAVALLDAAFNELYAQRSAQWSPHVSLESAKMCIRTAVSTAACQIKARYRDEEKTLNEDINSVVNAISANPNDDDKLLLMHKLDDLRQLKRFLVAKIGAKLEVKTARKWYNEGELSSKYFFNLLNRKNNDEITELLCSDGNVINEPGLINEDITNFYKNLYESVPQTIEETDDLFRNIQPVAPEVAAPMEQRITLEELEETLKTCADSAPGPDGIQYSFIKHFWKDMGPAIINAWNFSLDHGDLPSSHKLSYLKLIPKAGKDTRVITNLRPITLSNTDHKLITKTYAKKLTSIVSKHIGEEQTAYIPGRLINDNVRSILMTMDLAAVDNSVDGVVVSLDAKKAFDSVDHRFVRRSLKAFGLECFIPIFNTLYKDLRSDILINGAPIQGYKILKGVKQGDALSCILFIICMEPLIRNLKADQQIEAITSVKLNVNIPKAYSFADDVTVVTKRKDDCVRAIFKVYEAFSKESGLILNAEKTEMLRFNPDKRTDYELDISYMGVQHLIKSSEKIKINGILFLQDTTLREEANVRKCVDSMERLLKAWSTRSLTLIGRILIIKTFAISQCIYLMQSMSLNDASLKKFNNVVYKYLWNKNFGGNRAPERLKRSIMQVPVKYGGFGMTELSKFKDSLDLKSYGRLIVTNHPLFAQLKGKLNCNDFFNVSITCAVDLKLKRSLNLLNEDRKGILQWPTDAILTNALLRKIFLNLKFKDLLSPVGAQSLNYLLIQRRVRQPRLHQLTINEFSGIARYIKEPRLRLLLREVLGDPDPGDVDQISKDAYPIGENRISRISTLTCKELRVSRSNEGELMINTFKIGLILTPGELISWTRKIRGLTSTRHKNILLRVAHGDIFSNSRLCKFGLKPSSHCANCPELVESIKHRLLDCPKAQEAWRLLDVAKVTLNMNVLSDTSMENILGAKDDITKLELALQAELALRLSTKGEGYCPRQLVHSVITFIGNVETLSEVEKENFKSYKRSPLL